MVTPMADSGMQFTPRRRIGQFLITKPVGVEIDGKEAGAAPWGKTTDFAARPGVHRVTASFSYLGKKRMAEATIEVTVVAGAMTAMLYRSPWIVTNAGSLVVT